MNFIELLDFDLIAVGVSIIAIVILGTAVYLSDRNSVTNRALLLFSILTVLYGSVNFMNYQVSSADHVLWLLRFTLFFALWHAFSMFKLFMVFPNKTFSFSSKYSKILVPIVAIVSILTLTPLTFSGIGELAPAGEVTNPEIGFGIMVFVVLVLFLVFSGLYLLIKKTIKSKDEKRVQFKYVAMGTFITFAFLIAFNMVLPVAFNVVDLVPLAPLFILPFIAFTAFAIVKYGLFNVKVIATELLVFALWIFILVRALLNPTPIDLIANGGLLIVSVIVGIFLIRSVMKEVAQREQIETLAEDLAKANVRLRSLDKLKSEFLSFASHQLKSPLAAVKGYASLILEGDYGEIKPKVREAVGVIFESTDSLVKMVGDFLNITKIEQGGMKYEMEVIDMKNLTNQVVAELKPNVENKGLELKTDFQEGQFGIKADLAKLKQVFVNIIDNSVKYTPKGSITIGLTNPTPDKVLFFVKDTGVGIDPTEAKKLFAKFGRAKGASKVNVTGSGLGLYLAKQIVEAHKGKIWAESEGEGKGSTFKVELPVSK